MKKTSLLLLITVTLMALPAIATGTTRNSSALAAQAVATATDTGAELPPDAQALALDKPLIENLDPNSAIRFYTFTAKAGTNYRLAVEPKSGDFYTTVTVMTGDLQTIIAGTIGESVISGSLIFRAPADGMYVVTVEYASVQDGTPPSGSYQIGLSEFKPQ